MPAPKTTMDWNPIESFQVVARRAIHQGGSIVGITSNRIGHEDGPLGAADTQPHVVV
jgi:hypothetical protein